MVINFENITFEDAVRCYSTLTKGQKVDVLDDLCSTTGLTRSTWRHNLSVWTSSQDFSAVLARHRIFFTQVMRKMYGEVMVKRKEEEMLEEEMLLNED